MENMKKLNEKKNRNIFLTNIQKKYWWDNSKNYLNRDPERYFNLDGK